MLVKNERRITKNLTICDLSFFSSDILNVLLCYLTQIFCPNGTEY